jgi:Zinc finger, C3HC4 type (RING finger)
MRKQRQKGIFFYERMSGGSTNLGSTLDTYAPIGEYAPADFGDADDTRPIQILLDPTNTGTTTPYSTLMNNVLQRHTIEVKEKSVAHPVVTLNWRKKLRDFMIQKNEDLTAFLRKPLSQHPTFSQADIFMKRFGRMDFHPTHSGLQTVLLDASGNAAETYNRLQEELLKVGPSKINEVYHQVKWIYDSYREAGEETLRLDGLLKRKLDVLDKIFQKVLGFMELPVNNDTTELSIPIQTYLEKIYKENDIEESYNLFIESYRRFVLLKEMMTIHRVTDLVDKEPLCSICMSEPVTHTISPCGHTFCGTCCKRQTVQCYMCRTSIRERIRIFFG